MSNEFSSEGASSSQVNYDHSESTIGVNIKTLDSRMFSLRVEKNIPVPTLKEKIVAIIGVPAEQQRLIFRGKVLKDDQLLSELHMEDGDTLHLVVRQPAQSQPPSSTSAAEAPRNNNNQANDPSSGVQRNRAGPVAHGVLLGTVNVADRNSENMLTDLNRSIEAFLGSLGLVTVDPNGGANLVPTVSVLNPTSANVEAERSQSISTTEPSNSGQQGFVQSNNSPFLASTQFSQLPFVRTQQMVIPDALTTLVEFINRMELVFQSGNSSMNNTQPQPPSETSSLDARGLPTLEFLCSVIERAQQLLRDHAASALLNVSTRLQREGNTSDPVLRGQIQTEAMQLGVAMQHLGAMLLELGRTIMTLRMGLSPAESFVNTGPAVYISPAGPNPIMVQPSSLFGISSPPSVSGLSVGASPGSPLSNINIHLHAGSPLAPVPPATVGLTNPSEVIHGERPSSEQTATGVNGSSDSSSTRGIPLRTVISATPVRNVPDATGNVLSVTYPVHIRAQQSIPLQYAPQVAGSISASILAGGGQPHEQALVPPASVSIPAFVAQVTARIANALTGNALVQASSTGMPSIAAQDSHSVVGNGAQSGLPNPTVQPPQMNVHATQSILQQSSFSGDLQAQHSLSTTQPSQESRSREENLVASQEDLFSGNVGSKCDSINAGFTKHGKGKSSTAGLTESGKEGQQIKLDCNQISSTGFGLNTAESSAPTSSSSVLVDSQSTRKQSSSSDVESLKREPESVELRKLPPSNSQIESNMSAPLGLGLGGSLTKKQSKPTKPKRKDGGQAKASSSDQNQHYIAKVRETLRSLPLQTLNVDRENVNGSSSQHPSLISQVNSSMTPGEQGGNPHTDFSAMISNAMQNPAFSNLLTGVASQSGVPTGDLRSMLEQCVQSPAVQNTVNQLVQQVGQVQDNGNLQGTGQGRFDFGGMIQQMLPVVSQALGRLSSRSAPVQDMQSDWRPESNDAIESSHDSSHQVDLSKALEKIEQHDDPTSIFRTVLESAGHLEGDDNIYQDIAELGNDEELANEFLEVLKRDIKRRLDEES